VKSKTFSKALLCLGLVSPGLLAACAEGEPISESDLMARGKAGDGSGGSLAAGGNAAYAGTDVTSTGTSGGGSGTDNGAGGAMSTTDAGSAGSVDEGGMAGGGADYDGPLAAGLKVETLSQDAKGISFQVKLTNNGTDSPPVTSIKVRYYMIAEGISDASSIVFDYAAWNSGSNMAPYNTPLTGACKATFTKLPSGKPMADSYLEVGATSGDSVLNPKDTVEFHVRSTAQGEDPTNDYSYKANTAFAANDHIVVTQGGNVVAGTAP
jgi:hypothetical protein